MGKLSAPMTIAEVAAQMKPPRSPRQLKSVLLRMNEEVGGRLLVRSGGAENREWRVSMAALRKVFPDWFEAAEDLPALVEELQEKLEEERRRGAMAAQAIGNLSRRVEALAKANRAA